MMKEILSHLFQTLLILFCVVVLVFAPAERNLLVTSLIWGSVICSFILLGIFVLYKHKKCIVALLFLVMSSSAFAQAEETAPIVNPTADGRVYTTDELVSYRSQFCQRKSELQAATNNKSIQNLSVEELFRYRTEAFAYISAYDKEEDDSVSLSGNKKSAYDCAKKLVQLIADEQNRRHEVSASTVAQVLEKDKDSCWPCGIAHLMMDSVEKISLSLENDLKSVALDLLGLMLLFWILYKVLFLIGQWGSANLGEFFTELLTRLFIAVIAAAILQGPLSFVYNHTFSPMIGLTSELTKKFVDIPTTGLPTDSLAVNLASGSTSSLACDCCAEGSTSDCNKGSIEQYAPQYDGSGRLQQIIKTDSPENSLINKEAKRQLLCMTCAVYKQTSPMVAAGQVMVYKAINTSMIQKVWNLIKSIASFFSGYTIPEPFNMWLLGGALIVVFTILAYLIAFRLIDIFLRLGFAFLLTPFLITTFVFPMTRKYTKRGWDFLVHALLSIMSIALGMGFVITVFETSLPSTLTNNLKPLMSLTGDAPNGYAQDLYNAFAGNNGGAFYPTLLVIVFLFFGMQILKATQVIIEGLSELTCGIPSLSGAAVAAGIKAAYAPVRLATKAMQDRLDKLSKIKGKDNSNSNDDVPGVFSRLAKFTGDGMEKAGATAAQSIEKGSAVAGSSVEVTGAAAGKATQGAGRGMLHVGGSLSSSGIGAIVGVPLMVAGAAVTATGYGIEYGSKFAGKAIKMSGKATAKVIKTGSRIAAKGVKTAGKKAQKVWNKTKRNIKNRIKQVPSRAIRKTGRGIASVARKVGRQIRPKENRERAQNKYNRR